MSAGMDGEKENGLNNIGEGHNPGLQKNIFSFELIGIAGSIHPFMVFEG